MPTNRRHRRGWRRSWVTWLAVAVVLAAVAVTTWLATGTSAPELRVAAVTTGSVAQTLDSVGTVTPLDQANLGFRTSGTVATVAVSVGQKVSAGQELASLDTQSLQSAVSSAQSAVASAQARLDADQASQAAATSSASTAAATTSALSGAAPGAVLVATIARSAGAQVTSGGSGGSTTMTVQQAQSALLADQQRVDTDQQRATQDLSTAVADCGGSTTSTSTTSTSTSTSTSTTSTTAPASSTCTSALQTVVDDQAQVSQDLSRVSSDEAALAAALQASSGAPGATGSSGGTQKAPSTTTTPAGPSGGSAGSSSPKSGTSASSVPTPQQLASDQAALDLANAQLATAEQDLGAADLVSPIAGTVASISIAAGDSVTGTSPANAASAAVVVLGPGSYVVSTNVDVSSIGSVSVGEHATVVPDASGTTLAGTVSSIGILGTSSSGSTSYPVTVSIADGAGLQLSSGANAQVDIVVTEATGVLTVPTSAVRTIGSNHIVTVDRNGTTTPVRVTVGTVGDTLTQVTSGLTAGEQVVLADLGTPLPTSSTTNGRGGFGGFGGGGGFGGAGPGRIVARGG